MESDPAASPLSNQIAAIEIQLQELAKKSVTLEKNIEAIEFLLAHTDCEVYAGMDADVSTLIDKFRRMFSHLDASARKTALVQERSALVQERSALAQKDAAMTEEMSALTQEKSALAAALAQKDAAMTEERVNRKFLVDKLRAQIEKVETKISKCPTDSLKLSQLRKKRADLDLQLGKCYNFIRFTYDFLNQCESKLLLMFYRRPNLRKRPSISIITCVKGYRDMTVKKTTNIMIVFYV